MAVDEALLESVRDGGGPVLRTYTWSPPTLSLGYGQDLADVDETRCRQLGVDLVRRPTGGRAVLHWEELTYSYLSLPVGENSIQQAYRSVGHCLQRGLAAFGVDVELSRGRAGRGGHRAACFASTSRWEVTIGGRKLIGSAQRQIRGALLQHGSLLVGGGHTRLAELVAGESAAGIAAAAVHLREVRQDTDIDDLASCLAAGFAAELGRTLRRSGLTPGEVARARQLVEAKYGDARHLRRRQRTPQRQQPSPVEP